MYALVRAAKTYDHDYRPKSGNWSSVPDYQVARLILGALGALEPQPAPELAAGAKLAAVRELAQSWTEIDDGWGGPTAEACAEAEHGRQILAIIDGTETGK
jgi:hypothetical protein